MLVGDFLLGQAFRMMVEVGSLRALDILSAAATVIAEGEVMQLAAAKNTETTEDEYLAVIRGKTAELFAAACEVGPVIAERPKAEQAACRSYGMNLGIAFQLVDDAARLRRQGREPRQERRRRFPRGQDHPAGACCHSGAAPTRSAPSGSGPWSVARPEATDLEQALSIMRRHRRPRGYDRPCPPLRRHGPGRPRPVPERPNEAGAPRGGRFLHRSGALRKLRQAAPGLWRFPVKWIRFTGNMPGARKDGI